MSYAAVTAHNAAPLSAQPHPDLGLLNTQVDRDKVIPDVTSAKVNVVSHDFKQHPVTETSLHVEHSDEESGGSDHNVPGSQKRKNRKHRREAHVEAAEKQLETWYAWSKDRLFRPAVFGGVFTVVNLGVLGTLGYAVYRRPEYVTQPRYNLKPIVYSGLGLIALFGVEGEVAASYAKTPQGREELARARREGHYLYNRSKEVVLRPKVASGFLGAVNLVVLGTLGYTTYVHWDLDVWSKKNVSIATIGLITWFSAQGWAVERYIQEHQH